MRTLTVEESRTREVKRRRQKKAVGKTRRRGAAEQKPGFCFVRHEVRDLGAGDDEKGVEGTSPSVPEHGMNG